MSAQVILALIFIIFATGCLQIAVDGAETEAERMAFSGEPPCSSQEELW